MFILVVSLFYAHVSFAEGQARLTQVDAAVLIARYSGFFDRYISEEGTPSECLQFLNEQGIVFDMLGVLEGREYTEAEHARVMTQIDLILSGRVTVGSIGGVDLPREYGSWEEYCLLNNIHYKESYKRLVEIILRLDATGV